MIKTLLPFSFAFILAIQSCGLSLQGLTDPVKKDRDKNEQLKKQNEESQKNKEANDALNTSISFELTDEKDACKKIGKLAIVSEVEIVSCKLESFSLTIEARNPQSGVIKTEIFDFKSSFEESKEQIKKSKDDEKLFHFFYGTVGLIELSKKYHPSAEFTVL